VKKPVARRWFEDLMTLQAGVLNEFQIWSWLDKKNGKATKPGDSRTLLAG